MVEMAVDELVAELEQKGVESEDLDDLVHDEASKVASNVNNEGLAGQLEYLLEAGWTRESIVEHIRSNGGGVSTDASAECLETAFLHEQSPESTGDYRCLNCGNTTWFTGFDEKVVISQDFDVDGENIEYHLYDGGDVGTYHRIECRSCGATLWAEGSESDEG